MNSGKGASSAPELKEKISGKGIHVCKRGRHKSHPKRQADRDFSVRKGRGSVSTGPRAPREGSGALYGFQLKNNESQALKKKKTT